MTNLILDGNNTIFRAYHVGKKREIVDGINVTAVNHFMVMLRNYVVKFNPQMVYIAWDKKKNGGFNYRKDLVPYKENRPENPNIGEIYDCIDVIIEMTTALGMFSMYPWNLEADDVIAFLSRELDDNIIVSGDKDLFQLVSPKTAVYNTTKNVILNTKNFESITGISQDKFLIYKAALGDKSDNIPGLHRFGEVKSKSLANGGHIKTLNKEQIQVLERNLLIMDLTKGIEESDGEERFYKTQLEQSKDIITDEMTLKSLCKMYGMEEIMTYFTGWQRSIMAKDVLNTWFSGS